MARSISRIRQYSVLFVVSICSTSSHADCVARAFKGGIPDNPVYQIEECTDAYDVIERFRAMDPSWFGDVQLSNNDVALIIKPVNKDARALLGREQGVWYYSEGCDLIEAGIRLRKPRLKELCCDVGPITSPHCALGGTRLLDLSSRINTRSR